MHNIRLKEILVIPLYSKTGTSDLNNEKLFPKINKLWKSRQCSFCLLQDERHVLECLCDCDYDVDATVAYILQTMETVIGEWRLLLISYKQCKLL